jgi:dTDP-glucose 4,6-dehydratase
MQQKNGVKNILVTGGLGFIGSEFVNRQIKAGNFIVNIDKMTYAANIENVANVADHKNYHFVKDDINNQELIYNLLKNHNINYLVHFAAESHVDNSINSADVFIATNINGTFNLLQAAKRYYQELEEIKKPFFRFIHVSTDEVFGQLQENDNKFDEQSPYRPNSPYSASKAASDHLVRAWGETYKLPFIITNCSNNFGANQHNEKLIPTIIRNCITGNNIPIYGNGKNIRDWIFVGDHCFGIELAMENGKIGESYCFGGECEVRNIDIANYICEIIDKIRPRKDGLSYKEQITFVADRKGHDYRYAINNSKAYNQLGFVVSKDFKNRLQEVVEEILAKYK